MLERYDHYRPQMETGDCILWSGNSPISRLIRWRTGDYSHASLVIRFWEYDADRVYVLEAMPTGIVLSALSERLRNYSGKAYWAGLKPDIEYLRYDAAQFALSQVGTPYDYPNLIANALGRVSVDAQRWFCSEFWYAAICRDGSTAPTPSDIPKLGLTETPRRIL